MNKNKIFPNKKDSNNDINYLNFRFNLKLKKLNKQ